MNFRRLLSLFLVPSLAIAVFGCAETQTPDSSYEANRPVYEDDAAVTEDPVSTDYGSQDTTSEADTINEADTTGSASGAPGDPPAASGDAAGSQVTEDVEEEPASELPPEAKGQNESGATQP